MADIIHIFILICTPLHIYTQHIAVFLGHYLAVLECQVKHFSGATQQPYTNAVQHHAFAPLEYDWWQMTWLHALDESAKVTGYSLLRGRLFHDWKHRWNGWDISALIAVFLLLSNVTDIKMYAMCIRAGSPSSAELWSLLTADRVDTGLIAL